MTKEHKAAAGVVDELRVLEVIDALRVGPVQLGRRRLAAPYEVARGGTVDRNELIYQFEEDVFDPALASSRNLAAMIAAQVALNYGLFCRQIEFRGDYDRHDRSFIEEYLAHTAREIYVQKFLMPNPFLTGAAAGLAVVKSRSYLRARVRFESPCLRESSLGPPAVSSSTTRTAWRVEGNRVAVLSSGGKDSLLSFGLLREIGQDVHPIFGNESGRHWFTALNAYRHLDRHVPGTARVWTNADRLFTWMLRRLPFVRQDFARIRSDEYPIRLWTVAVFLFGALPLCAQHGLGRIVIGDEFDTTVRTSYAGITHYGGLFDQSCTFDNAMTRYFRRKGWGISQFSVLRPMSELLILKTLVERYPDLQALQTSCHATHVEADRIRPCGQCEKCRRVVAMLTALGADPRRCGYTDRQIADCLAHLGLSRMHQEGPAREHLFYLLRSKGHLVDPRQARAHPEVMKLRFDTERSPFETIPSDIRRPIFEILLQHADGAVARNGRRWLPIDPLSSEALTIPHPFEIPLAGAPGR